MITATAETRELIDRLKSRATEIAERHGAGVARTLNRGPVDWRAARSLWPDLTKGD